MKDIFYDWMGLNNGLFKALYHGLNTPFIDDAWRVLSYGYSYWSVAFIALFMDAYYLATRHTASEPQFTRMSEQMAVLILAFSLVWCTIYTVQTITLWPSPWVVYPDGIALQKPMLWHEGFPASAPAIAMMVSSIFWRYAKKTERVMWAAYVIAGCLLSIISGINWPADVVYGVVVGFVGVRLARRYYQLGVRLVSS